MLVYASYHFSIHHHPKGSHHCFSNGSLPIHVIVLPLFKYQKNHNCPKKKAVGHQQLSKGFPVISHFRRKKKTSAKNKRFPEVVCCVGANFPRKRVLVEVVCFSTEKARPWQTCAMLCGSSKSTFPLSHSVTCKRLQSGGVG